MASFTNFQGMVGLAITAFNGLDLQSKDPLLYIDRMAILQNSMGVNLYFMENIFKFYYKGKLVDSELCDAQVFENADIRLFSNMENVNLGFTNNNDFRAPICPYAFKNANLNAISNTKFTNTKFFKNEMRFLEIKNTKNSSIDVNANIFTLEFEETFYTTIDSTTISPHVFARTNTLTFSGQPSAIDENIFKNLKKLKCFDFFLRTVRNFFHSSDNKWMAGLNFYGEEFKSQEEIANLFKPLNNSTISYFRFIIAETSVTAKYKYPEEDFCLFKYFPQRKAIVTFLFAENPDFAYILKRHPATSTVRLLLKNTNFFKWENVPMNQTDGVFLLNFEDFEYNETDLFTRIGNCNTTRFSSIPSQGGIYFNYFDFFYALEWIEFLGPIITFPIIAAMSFFFNLIIILVITNKKNKSLKLFEAKMFDYILLTSVFNCLECFIYEFRLIGMCMGIYSVYCSTIRVNAKYFTVIVNGFMSETVKTASIFTGLLFSIVRYAETSQTDNRIMKNLFGVKIQKIAFWVLGVSSLLSINKVFEYHYRGKLNDYDLPSPFSVSMFWTTVIKVELVFYFLHYIINDFVILIINLVIDIKLVFIIKANLKHKIDAMKNTVETDFLANTRIQVKNQKLEESLKKKKSVENKANALIVANVFIYFFCRIPELAGMLYFPFFRFSDGYCTNHLLCYLIYNTMEYMYMLSYAFTILICYKFNSNFQIGFKNLFRSKNKK